MLLRSQSGTTQLDRGAGIDIIQVVRRAEMQRSAKAATVAASRTDKLMLNLEKGPNRSGITFGDKLGRELLDSDSARDNMKGLGRVEQKWARGYVRHITLIRLMSPE